MRYLSILAVLLFCGVSLVRAQDVPAGDVAGSYSFFREGVTNGVNANGATISTALNIKPWFGIAGDFGVYHAEPFSVGLNTFTYQGGPRFYLRTHSRVTPFAQVLVGGAHLSAGGGGASGSANGFAFSAGGGVDLGLSKHWAVRPQVDYLGIHSSGDTLNSIRASVGVVFRFGK
jgi:Outer membrane protein beta-barrel domain